MAAPYAKVDANLDDHPKILEAGFWGSVVFQLILRINRRHQLDGVVPARYFTKQYLLRQLNLEEKTHGISNPSRCVLHGLKQCVKAQLLTKMSDGQICIVGYGDEWAGPASSTERVQAWRARQEGGGNDPKRSKRSSNVTGNDVTASPAQPSPDQPSPPKTRSSSKTGQKKGPSKKQIRDATAVVIDYLNRKAKRSLTYAAYEDQVARLLKLGFTEKQMKVVVWWSIREWGTDPEYKKRINPNTLFKLQSPQGYRTFKQYLSEAIEQWNKEFPDEPFVA